MRSIHFYRTSKGNCPVEEFLDSLPDKHAQKVVWTLRLVERMDRVPEQYFKKLSGTDGIWEIRTQTQGASYRILGFFDGHQLFIVTSGFSKKQQKTPQQEIELAIQRRNEYKRRAQTP